MRLHHFIEQNRRTLTIALILALVVAAFWGLVSIQNAFYGAVEYIENFIATREVLGIAIFVLLAALSGILSPFSSAPLVPVAIIVWGKGLTALLLGAGWLLGGIVAYFFAIRFGHPFVERFSSFQKIETYRERLGTRKEFWLVFFFRIAFPSELASYVLGLVNYPLLKYLFVTALTEALFAVITVSTGEAILEKNFTLFIALGAATLLLIVAINYFFHRRKAA